MPATKPSQEQVDRRRAVRMKPITELPASATVVGDQAETFTISDMGIGGMGLVTSGSLACAQIGQRFEIKLSLSHYGEHVISVEVRYMIDSGLTGVQFVDLSPEATKAIRRYVAELLERGAPS